MSRIHFIVNPTRPSIGLSWPHEEKKIEALTQDFSVHICRGRMHAEILTRQAMEAGAELIVSVGGDSTLNEIVNGLYRASQGGRPVPKLAVYGGLQQGDTIRSLNASANFIEFLEHFLQGKVQQEKLDLAEIEFTGEYGQKIRRFFVNCAGVGFSASIIHRISKDFKIRRSKLSLFWLVFRLLPFYRHPKVNVAVDGKSVSVDQDILTCLIHNGRFASHGQEFSPKSIMSDGSLEFTLIRKSFTINYVYGVLALFARKLSSVSFVTQASCHYIDILPSERLHKVQMDFDGDCWGYLPAHIRVLEGALTLVR